MSEQGEADPGREAASLSLPRGPLVSSSRLVLVGLVDALLIIALASTISVEWWLAVGFFAFALVALNVTYLSGRFLPLKYLLPGLLFLIVFQLYTMAFTGYSSFTNYGTGHVDDKDAAITAIEQGSVVPVEGGREYRIAPLLQRRHDLDAHRRPGQRCRLHRDQRWPDTRRRRRYPARRREGHRRHRIRPPEPRVPDIKPDAAGPVERLAGPARRTSGKVPSVRVGHRGAEAQPGFVYDADQDAMIETSTGTVYPADESRGNFVSASGEVLFPGWRVNVGFANYVSLVTDETLRSAFLPITAWTFFFAFATTVLNFALGLLLALTLSERRMGRKGIYRFLLILPYGLPALLMTLVWKGMLNTDFGVINRSSGRTSRGSTIHGWPGSRSWWSTCGLASRTSSWSARERSRRSRPTQGGRLRRRRIRPIRLPHRGPAAAPGCDGAPAGHDVRLQLQQLHADPAADRRRAVPWHLHSRAGRPTC